LPAGCAGPAAPGRLRRAGCAAPAVARALFWGLRLGFCLAVWRGVDAFFGVFFACFASALASM
jgi:hypothetical protein